MGKPLFSFNSMQIINKSVTIQHYQLSSNTQARLSLKVVAVPNHKDNIQEIPLLDLTPTHEPWMFFIGRLTKRPYATGKRVHVINILCMVTLYGNAVCLF